MKIAKFEFALYTCGLPCKNDRGNGFKQDGFMSVRRMYLLNHTI